MSVLLYVEGQNRADELRQMLIQAIDGVEFLQREICTPDKRFPEDQGRGR